MVLMSQMDQSREKIDSLSLNYIKQKFIHRDGWLEMEADAAVEQYKNFLWLHLKYPDAVLSPSLDIDLVWHEHILSTKFYLKDCEEIYGYFLHHAPQDVGEPLNEEAFALMKSLYKKETGKDLLPVRPNTWLRRFIKKLVVKFLQ